MAEMESIVVEDLPYFYWHGSSPRGLAYSKIFMVFLRVTM